MPQDQHALSLPEHTPGKQHIKVLSLLTKAWTLVAAINVTPIVTKRPGANHAPAAPTVMALKDSGPSNATQSSVPSNRPNATGINTTKAPSRP